MFKSQFVTPGVLAEGLAEAQVRFPRVPIVFCETRPLAQEWTYRFLRAASPTPAEIRVWAIANGQRISAKGRIPASVLAAFSKVHASDE